MESPWNNEDAKRLRRFLNSETGKKLIDEYKSTEPAMDATTIEGRALQAAAFQEHRNAQSFVKSRRDFVEPDEQKRPWIDTEALEVRE